VEIEKSHGPDPETASREPEVFETSTSTDDQRETKTDVSEPEIYEFLPGLPENRVGEESVNNSSSVFRPVSVQVPVCQTVNSDAQKSRSVEIVVSIDKASAACGHESVKTFSYPLLVFRRESTESTNIDTSKSERCSDKEATSFQSRTSDAEDTETCDSNSDCSEVKVPKPENFDHSEEENNKKDQDKLYNVSASDEDGSGGYGTESEVHSETENDCGKDEESNSTNESDAESGSEQEDSKVETSSDDERSAYSSRRHLSEGDQCWLRGLGSLNGYRLATAEYLRTLFMSRNPSMQVDMIQEVVGDGPMKGDRYNINDQDLLGELLKDLNAQIPASLHITERGFNECRAKYPIKEAVSRMIRRRVTHEDRWNCFKFALSIRSRRECGRILCTEAFDFTTEEWQWLEWSARN
jgi:hypothetical protein